MYISKKYFLTIIAVISAICFSDNLWTNYELVIPDFKYRTAYQEKIDNDQVTIIDKDGEIAIFQLMDNGIIVCL